MSEGKKDYLYQMVMSLPYPAWAGVSTKDHGNGLPIMIGAGSWNPPARGHASFSVSEAKKFHQYLGDAIKAAEEAGLSDEKVHEPTAASHHRRRIEAMSLLTVQERAAIAMSFAVVTNSLTQEGFDQRARLLSAIKDANKQDQVPDDDDV